MKNSGGGSGARRDTDDVFDFLLGNSEVVRDVREVIACDESINEILDSCATTDQEREAERALWIDHDPGIAVRGQLKHRSPAVVCVADPPQVAPDELGELLLAGANDRELEEVGRATFGGIVEEDFRTIGVEVLRR